MQNNIAILKPETELIEILKSEGFITDDTLKNTCQLLSSEMIIIEKWNDNGTMDVSTRHVYGSDKMRFTIPQSCIRLADKPDPNITDLQNENPHNNC